MSKISKTDRKEQYILKRKSLIELSKVIRIGVKEGMFDSVNEGLKQQYMEADSNIEEFKTFFQWKQSGATVKKGQTAFLLWGQPRNVSQVPEGATEPEEFKYWPICYLFANTQVYAPGKPESDVETKQEKAPVFEPVMGDDY